MSNAYVIEVDGGAAGVVVRENRSFRFYASDRRYSRLEGSRYGSLEEAERAVKSVKTDVLPPPADRRQAAGRAQA